MCGGNHFVNYGGELTSGIHQPSVEILKNFLFEKWPMLRNVAVTNRWNANVCFTGDGLPSIGRLPETESVFYAYGYSGEGMSTSIAAGRLLSELITDKVSPFMQTPLLNRLAAFVPPDPLRSIAFSVVRDLN